MVTKLKDLFPNTWHKFSTKGQLNRVLDELVEAETELVKDNRELFLKEMIDVLHCASGVLYKSHYNYTDIEIENAIMKTQDKNRGRGYYDKNHIQLKDGYKQNGVEYK
jgi:hypothetical protein